jgi:hypothetical protein
MKSGSKAEKRNAPVISRLTERSPEKTPTMKRLPEVNMSERLTELVATAQRKPISGDIEQKPELYPGAVAKGTMSVPEIQERISVPHVSAEGERRETVAHGAKLNGKTHASFSNSYKTRDLKAEPVMGDDGKKRNLIHFTGTLVSKFKVTTRVSLPSVWSFKGLTKCQRRLVQEAITNELAPHEQEHVAAFKTYDGTIEESFGLTATRQEFAAIMKQMHNATETVRRSAAQDASEALDPFEIDVDLDCED